MLGPEEVDQVLRIDAAFRAGDLEALKKAVEPPWAIPNGPMPLAIGHCLAYAIYLSPLRLIEDLLRMGADPNPSDHAGYPPLIAALWENDRPDVMDVVALLLTFGADPDQRGFNDYTALHVAVEAGNRPAVAMLLSAGADPEAATRIDDLETPLDLARKAGASDLVELLGGG